MNARLFAFALCGCLPRINQVYDEDTQVKRTILKEWQKRRIMSILSMVNAESKDLINENIVEMKINTRKLKYGK